MKEAAKPASAAASSFSGFIDMVIFADIG